MPELAEVEITRLKLLPLVKGRRILDFWTDWPRGMRIANRPPSLTLRRASKLQSAKRVAADMRGRVIRDITRHGKVLFFELAPRPRARGRAGGARTMAIHLRMSGRLVVANSFPVKTKPSANTKTSKYLRSHLFVGGGLSNKLADNDAGRWTHFVWRLSGRPPSGRTSPSAGGKELHFVDPRKFGTVWYGSENDLKRDKYLANLGRDARRIPYPVFREAVQKKSGMVKAVLLRQDVLSGIGNIMADETLWRAKIHPQTKIGGLSESDLIRLHKNLGATIRAMLSSGGTSLRDWGHPDGKLGGYQEQRKIYSKAGEPCPRCGTKLERLVVAGRGTTVCPKCQRA